MGHHKKKNKKHKSKHRKRSSSDSDSPEEHTKKQRVIGPSLPIYLPSPTPAPTTSTSNQDDSYGPLLPPHLTKPKETVKIPQPRDDEDHGEVIGPLPAGLQDPSSSQQALDERAEILKYNFLLQNCEKDDVAPQRDSWMTELPPEKANAFGLGPRKFRTAAITGDPKNRALWTETPLDKDKQPEIVEDTNIFEDMVVSQRNKVMDDIVKKTKKEKPTKSLLEIHQEKLKKKKKVNISRLHKTITHTIYHKQKISTSLNKVIVNTV